MDYHQFGEALLEKATAALLRTRDGPLRSAVPSPLESCTFLNDVSAEEMNSALRRHKELMKDYPRNGEGLEAYVDASDTGYTENPKMEEGRVVENAAKKAGLQNYASGHIENGVDGIQDTSSKVNGRINGSASVN
ncbi:hypothetical protein G7Y89_g1924 [Cudoniella acicularis]|uniref:Uncharacterized protein n=1 Tax=Cudoniella acicularis TaxID=354080 RepID=A0A8H4RV57_9HELO|nr:hypothetical protein G7Y89_g1924 [Cudoniella acicularis]